MFLKILVTLSNGELELGKSGGVLVPSHVYSDKFWVIAVSYLGQSS